MAKAAPPKKSVEFLKYGYIYSLVVEGDEAIERNWTQPMRFKQCKPLPQAHKTKEGDCEICDENGATHKKPVIRKIKVAQVEKPREITFM